MQQWLGGQSKYEISRLRDHSNDLNIKEINVK